MRRAVPAGRGFENLGEGDLPSEHSPMKILFLVLAKPLFFLLLLVCAILGCLWSRTLPLKEDMVLCHSETAFGESCFEPILAWSDNFSQGGKENCIRDIAFLLVMPASAVSPVPKLVFPKIETEPRSHSGSNNLFLPLIGQILLSPSPQQHRCRRLPPRLPSRSCPRPRRQAGLWRSWRWRH